MMVCVLRGFLKTAFFVKMPVASRHDETAWSRLFQRDIPDRHLNGLSYVLVSYLHGDKRWPGNSA